MKLCRQNDFTTRNLVNFETKRSKTMYIRLDKNDKKYN